MMANSEVLTCLPKWKRLDRNYKGKEFKKRLRGSND